MASSRSHIHFINGHVDFSLRCTETMTRILATGLLTTNLALIAVILSVPLVFSNFLLFAALHRVLSLQPFFVLLMG